MNYNLHINEFIKNKTVLLSILMNLQSHLLYTVYKHILYTVESQISKKRKDRKIVSCQSSNWGESGS